MAIPLPNSHLPHSGLLNAVVALPYTAVPTNGAIPTTLSAPTQPQPNAVAAPTTVAAVFGVPSPGVVPLPLLPADFAVIHEYLTVAPPGTGFIYKGHVFVKPLCPGFNRRSFELSAQAPPPLPRTGVLATVFDPEMDPETLVCTPQNTSFIVTKALIYYIYAQVTHIALTRLSSHKLTFIEKQMLIFDDLVATIVPKWLHTQESQRCND